MKSAVRNRFYENVISKNTLLRAIGGNIFERHSFVKLCTTFEVFLHDSLISSLVLASFTFPSQVDGDGGRARLVRLRYKRERLEWSPIEL